MKKKGKIRVGCIAPILIILLTAVVVFSVFQEEDFDFSQAVGVPVLEIAKNEIGYIEKATNDRLESKTGNSGVNDYTKYSDFIDENCPNFYNGTKNGYPWCDVFADWCFITAYGENKAREMLCQPERSCGAGCSWSAEYYKKENRFFDAPQVGDQIFFCDLLGEPYHTGLVYRVTKLKVYTIEGNTSSNFGVEDDGQGVAAKSYYINSPQIYGYGRPWYE